MVVAFLFVSTDSWDGKPVEFGSLSSMFVAVCEEGEEGRGPFHSRLFSGGMWNYFHLFSLFALLDFSGHLLIWTLLIGSI